MELSRWLLMLAVVAAGMNSSGAQEKRTGPVEYVEPEVRGEAPPLMLDESGDASGVGDAADRVADRDAEQLATALLRAQESLQLDNRTAAMQALIQAEEQLDEVVQSRPNEERWQRIDQAIQSAMKALGSNSPEHALVALERATVQLEDVGGARQSRSILEDMPASGLLGVQVVNSRGEAIAEISQIVRARTGGGDLYAILEVDGGLLGMDDKAVAIALDHLEAAADDRVVLPQVTESQLEEMPAYDQEGYEQVR